MDLNPRAQERTTNLKLSPSRIPHIDHNTALHSLSISCSTFNSLCTSGQPLPRTALRIVLQDEEEEEEEEQCGGECKAAEETMDEGDDDADSRRPWPDRQHGDNPVARVVPKVEQGKR